MGLFYVRNIVKSHYGTLRIESHPETGDQFFIMLPRYGTKRYRRRGGEITERKIRILVAEDFDLS